MPPALEHLQQAALEAVRATRALLDAAESAIRDPTALEGVIRTAAGLARTTTETVAGFAAGMREPGGGDGRRTDGSRHRDDPDAGTGYHDIAVG